MERVILHSTPRVEAPVVVVAMTGAGNVGPIAIHELLAFSDAKKFGELYTKSLPDYITIGDSGICSLPRFDLYSSDSVKPNLVAIMSDSQILSDDPKSHYDTFDGIIRFTREYRASMIVGVDGIIDATQKSKTIYVSATSVQLMQRFCQNGYHICGAGKLSGPVGLLIGLCGYNGIDGVGVLGSTASFVPDYEAGKRAYEFLTRNLSITKTLPD